MGALGRINTTVPIRRRPFEQSLDGALDRATDYPIEVWATVVAGALVTGPLTGGSFTLRGHWACHRRRHWDESLLLARADNRNDRSDTSAE